MRHFSAIFGAALLSLGNASIASAAVVIESGSFGAGESLQIGTLSYYDDSVPPELQNPGKYRYTIEFSTPVAYFDEYSVVEKLFVYDWTCKDGNDIFWCGGNDEEMEHYFNQVSSTQYSLEFRLDRPRSFVPENFFSDVVRVDTYEACCRTDISFDTAAAGTYTFSASAIPEPATWMMLLLGFGAVGASLRSARHRQPQPANA